MSVKFVSTLSPFRNNGFSLLDEAVPVKACKALVCHTQKFGVLHCLRLVRPPFWPVVVNYWPALALKRVLTVLFVVATHLILEFVGDSHSLCDLDRFVHRLFRFVVMVLVCMLVVVALVLSWMIVMVLPVFMGLTVLVVMLVGLSVLVVVFVGLTVLVMVFVVRVLTVVVMGRLMVLMVGL